MQKQVYREYSTIQCAVKIGKPTEFTVQPAQNHDS